MFHLLDRFAKDDNTVKAVFDHLRSIGLIAIVLGAAAWKLKHIGEGWVAIWDHAAAAVLGFLGFGLAWLNHENLFSKIRRSGTTRWLKLLVAFLYMLVFGQLIQFLQAGRG
ncbi:hypothetical protein MJ904_18900 [Massilia sp. MB5]|uniref:hypothetical protein n=1 Tax=Massilia sp. MB5 TaxID=2919578 RepID=UPI001F0D3867|nr:hypothetical protein [Massilia sp. MB5]UMR29150.1 hypothetical protein MJ904_18900 [Massilia sp. MB5]